MDVAKYQAQGWVLSEKIFSDAAIQEMIVATDEFYAGKKERELPQRIQEAFDWKPGVENKVHTNEYIDYQKTVIRKHILNPKLGEIVATLMGEDEVFVFNTALFAKPPHKGHNETVWHIDHTYLANFSSENSISAWIPLQDIGPNDSPLVMINGSHHWNITEEDENRLIEKIPYSTTPSRHPNFPLSQGRVDIEVTPLIMKKGQVSFHHLKTLHGRCPNLSSKEVRAITVHFQDAHNHFKPWSFSRESYLCKNMSELLYRKLPNGYPDFYDPDFCPRVWPPLA